MHTFSPSFFGIVLSRGEQRWLVEYTAGVGEDLITALQQRLPHAGCVSYYNSVGTLLASMGESDSYGRHPVLGWRPNTISELTRHLVEVFGITSRILEIKCCTPNATAIELIVSDPSEGEVIRRHAMVIATSDLLGLQKIVADRGGVLDQTAFDELVEKLGPYMHLQDLQADVLLGYWGSVGCTLTVNVTQVTQE